MSGRQPCPKYIGKDSRNNIVSIGAFCLNIMHVLLPPTKESVDQWKWKWKLHILHVDCSTRREGGLHWHFQLGTGPSQNEQRHHGDERGAK